MYASMSLMCSIFIKSSVFRAVRFHSTIERKQMGHNDVRFKQSNAIKRGLRELHLPVERSVTFLYCSRATPLRAPSQQGRSTTTE